MDNQLDLKRSTIIRSFLLITGFLLAAAIVGLIFEHGLGHDHVFGLGPTVNFRNETNLPTLFNTLLLFVNGAMMIVIWRLNNGSSGQRIWFFLALLVFFIGYDEYASLHEVFADSLPEEFPDWYFVIPYLAVGSVLGLFFLPVFFRLKRSFQGLLLISAIMYIIGAMDSFRLFSLYLGIEDLGLSRSLNTMAEELLEIFGLIVLCDVLIRIVEQKGGVRVDIARKEDASQVSKLIGK